MGLVICPGCGQQVSGQAPACLGCGLQFGRATSSGTQQILQTQHVTWTVLGFIVLGAVLGAIALVSDDDTAHRARTPPSLHLHAGVRFTGALFVISNNDSFAWEDCIIEVNPGGLPSGFVYRAPRLDAGGTYNVGTMQFANNEGKTLTFEPTSISISCRDVPATKSGWYYATWN